MPRYKNMLTEENFNFPAFSKDLRKRIAEERTTIEEVSVRKLLHSESYLGTALARKRLHLNIVMALSDLYGLNLRDYEVVPKEEPKEEVTPCPTGWSCEIKVDEEYGTVMMKIMKDGEKVAVGRSYLYGGDPVGVLQGISYAAHMCYKLTQQDAIEGMAQPADRVLFKDWLKKYENSNSVYGSFARYVSSHYDKFPASGEKAMRYYLRLNHGETHMVAFGTLFKMYLAWYKECRDIKMPPAATDGKPLR